jgi:hypothetical protein
MAPLPGAFGMASPVVTPLIPPRMRSGGRSGSRPGAINQRRVPLSRVPSSRDQSSVYGLAVVNNRGRVAAQSVLHALGWQPGTHLSIREQAGLVVVTADPAGASRLTGEGHLRIPAPVRRWCALAGGSQVLLVADHAARRLVIHPPQSLDAMVGRCHAAVFGGGDA